MFHAFLQLFLAALAIATPISGEQQATIIGMNPSQQYGTGGGILGFIVLVLDIIVWVEVLKSNRPPSHKLAWSLLVFIFPIVGVVVYYLFSDRKKWNSGGYEVIP